VLGGVDFFDLASKKQGTDGPVYGSSKFTATLSGYTFYFLNAANRDAFNSDPWAYAPAWGGF
jgi:YHS domain-containing protein